MDMPLITTHVLSKAVSRGVVVFCLPSHTTHAMLASDSTCFCILKKEWDRCCDVYMAQHPGKFANNLLVFITFIKA